jgi:ferredoxin
MCETCVQHGEGKKWYLQAKNFEKEVLKGVAVVRGMIASGGMSEENAVNFHVQFDKIVASDLSAAKGLLTAQTERRKNSNGQIVPIEDAEQILNLSSNIVRLSCPCRRLRGVHDARYCIGLNVGAKELETMAEYPDYARDFEVLSKEEAKKLFREFDREGLVHTVFAHTPFILGICNCDSTYCQALAGRARWSHLGFNGGITKAEYVSSVDWEKCNGCRECMKLCNFGAISYSAAVKKCSINQFKCCGSGLCRSTCPTRAITMRDRNTIPMLAKDW